MSSIFNGLNIGYKALQVQKKSLDVTGHNIANANTDGYSRQRVIQTADVPHPIPGLNMPSGPGQLGTGVTIEEISRIREEFIDSQINEESQSLGFWKQKYEGLHRIELIFNEPSDSSLDFALTEFWKSLQDLGSNPENPAVRETVKERAVALTDTFHTIYSQLREYKVSLNESAASMVNEINSYAQQIADINTQIVSIKASGNNPNDLLDKRDLLFEKLNGLINVRGNVDREGNLNISLNGVGLVRDSRVQLLELRRVETAEQYEDVIVFKRTGEEAGISSGQLGGLLNIRNEEIDNYLDQLDKLAGALKEKFNTIHQAGFDYNGEKGLQFFTTSNQVWQPAGSYRKDALIEYEGNLYRAKENFAASDTGIESDLTAGRLELVGKSRPANSMVVNERITENINLIAAGWFGENTDYSNNPGTAAAYITDLAKLEVGHEYSIEISEDPDTGEGSYQIIDLTDNNAVEASGVFDGSEIEDPTDSSGVKLSEKIGIVFTVKDYGEALVDLRPQGNGANAVKMAQVIREDNLFNDGKAHLPDFYGSLIANLGIDTQRADQMVSNQNVLVNQLNNQRASISGVSLDGEMANLIKYQQAYNAAARIITRTDKLLDTLMEIIR